MILKTVKKLLLLKATVVCLLFYVSVGNASPMNQEIRPNSLMLNLSYEEIITKSPNIIDFKEMKPPNVVDFIKNRYLTFYSNKTEKIKATYLEGSYAINYTQKW